MSTVQLLGKSECVGLGIEIFYASTACRVVWNHQEQT